MFQGNSRDAHKGGEDSGAPTPRKGKVQHSIIGPNLKITGDLHSAGDITVHGTVEGSITCRSLTLGEAPTASKVTAETVRVSGAFDGEISAKEVYLSRNARVTGDIWHESIAIEPGASIEGRLGKPKRAKAAKPAKAAEKITPLQTPEAAAAG